MKVPAEKKTLTDIPCVEKNIDKDQFRSNIDAESSCTVNSDIQCDVLNCSSLNICDLLDLPSSAHRNPLVRLVSEPPDLIMHNEKESEFCFEKGKEESVNERNQKPCEYKENLINCTKGFFPIISKQSTIDEQIKENSETKLLGITKDKNRTSSTFGINSLAFEAKTTLDDFEKKLPKDVNIPQYFEEVYLENCKNTTFGTKIDSAGNIIINQFVDLGDIGDSPHPEIIVKDSSRKKVCCTKLRYVLAVVLLLCVVVTIAVFGSYFAIEVSKEDYGSAGEKIELEEEISYGNYTIPRNVWSTHRNVTMKPLPIRPARFIVVCHTAGSTCFYSSTCTNVARSIESLHIQKGLGTVWYNFLIGGDGHIYEGRGWDMEGAHSPRFNCSSIGIAFMGNFDNNYLTPVMMTAFNWLVEEGVREGHLAANYTLVGHYQVKNTASPGLHVRELIKTWPHWGYIEKEDFCIYVIH